MLAFSLAEGQALDDRLKRFFEKYPEADADGDGKLTREEAFAYRDKRKAMGPQPGDSRPGAERGPRPEGKRYAPAELAKVYEAKEFDGMPYRFFAPKREEGRRYPLVLSLHGAGGKGDDNLRNLKTWNGTLIEPEFQAKHPCFIVAPQNDGPWRVAGSEPDLTPELIATFPEIWQRVAKERSGFVNPSPDGGLGKVFVLLDQVASDYPIDPDRVYVLGHSMGGFGSFESIAMQPNRFAAAIPSAGGLSPWHDPATFRHVPIWAFHSSEDRTVLPELTEVVFERMKELDGNMKFTRLGDVGHGAAAFAFVYTGDAMNEKFTTKLSGDACDPTEDVWEWLFAQTRGTDR